MVKITISLQWLFNKAMPVNEIMILPSSSGNRIVDAAGIRAFCGGRFCTAAGGIKKMSLGLAGHAAGFPFLLTGKGFNL